MINRFRKGDDIEAYLVELSETLAGSEGLARIIAGGSTPTTTNFVAPKLTTAERDALVGPAAGMLVFNTTTGVLNCYSGSAWGAV